MHINKKINTYVKLITLVFSIILISAFASNSYADDLKVLEEKSFQINPGNDLRIKISGGDVTVTSWNKSEVYIKILGNDNAEEYMNFEFENDDKLVELIARKKSGFSSWFSGIDVEVEVKVPEEFNSYINTSGGDIKYGGVTGRAELNTSGGDVWGEKFSGRLEISTSGGDISLIGSNTKIDAHTSGGDIKLDYTGENKGINLNTSGGDIVVKLPENFNASINLSTSGGDVYCGLPLRSTIKSSNSRIVGELNNGGEELVAQTSGGDIDVIER